MELEEQLRIMIIQMRKTEQAAIEAISILETNGMNDLTDAIDSSFDKKESTIDGKGCKEDFRSGPCTKANEERIVIADAQSNSYLEDSSSQLTSFSWTSHCSNPNSPQKPKGNPIKQRYRQKSFMLYVESPPKCSLEKSCYKIKQEDKGYAFHFFSILFIKFEHENIGVCSTRSASADLVGHYAINHDEL